MSTGIRWTDVLVWGAELCSTRGNQAWAVVCALSPVGCSQVTSATRGWSRVRKSEEELRLEEALCVYAALLASGLAKWGSRIVRWRLQSVILQSREQAASD